MATTEDPAPTGDLRKDLALIARMIGALGEEIRLKAHLLGMDARSEWKRIEPRLADAERIALEASHASKATLETLMADLSKLVVKTRDGAAS